MRSIINRIRTTARLAMRRLLITLSLTCVVWICTLTGAAEYQHQTYDGGILVDNNCEGYAETGQWQDGADSYYVHGQSTRLARASKAKSATATFTPRIPEAGVYRVYWWRIRKGKVRIEIEHADGRRSMDEDLKNGHYGWWPLGDYRFEAGTRGTIKATVLEGDAYVDSIRLLPIARVPKPVTLRPHPKPDGTAPRLDRKVGGHNLIVSGQPVLVLYQEWGEATADSPEDIPYFDFAFDNALNQGVNTIGPILSWKDFEPQQGQYDYRILDALIEKARVRNMHLTIVWFGTWRNLQSYYVPNWVSKDRARFFTMKKQDGTNDGSYRISPFCLDAADADARALSAMLERVKQKDPALQVVTMVQVENEMPGGRCYSPEGQKAWAQAVPADLMDFFVKNRETIDPYMRDEWKKNGFKTSGTWADVFGDTVKGGEIFGAYYFGRYVERVITQAKKVLDLPMYCNSWHSESPCFHETMDAFHAGAPSLEGMGPDRYGSEEKWEESVRRHLRPWNALVLPEQHHSTKTMWKAFGTYGALLNGEYHTVEGCDWLRSREAYQVISSMDQLVCERKGTDRMRGFYQTTQKKGETWTEDFDGLKLILTATVDDHVWSQGKDRMPEEWNNIDPQLDGCGMIMKLDEGDYVITSTRIDVTLERPSRALELVSAAEGHFEDNRWVETKHVEVGRDGARLTCHFPTQNKTFGQIRLKAR